MLWSDVGDADAVVLVLVLQRDVRRHGEVLLIMRRMRVARRHGRMVLPRVLPAEHSGHIYSVPSRPVPHAPTPTTSPCARVRAPTNTTTAAAVVVMRSPGPLSDVIGMGCCAQPRGRRGGPGTLLLRPVNLAQQLRLVVEQRVAVLELPAECVMIRQE